MQYEGARSCFVRVTNVDVTVIIIISFVLVLQCI